MGTAQRQLFPLESPKALKHRKRKAHNQYFTPEFAVEETFSFIADMEVKNIMDPAVGEGVFLKVALRRWEDAKLFGVDIDDKFISELKQLGLPQSFFWCADSLNPKIWETIPEIQRIISSGGFDLVVGNPPFSSWFNRIQSKEILSNYQLAYRNGKLMKSQCIEVLFLEIFIRLAKSKGFIIIVLPDGILSNPQYRYVREFILKETVVKNIISLPRNVFQDTSAKTSIMVLQKTGDDSFPINYCAKLSELKKERNSHDFIEVSNTDLVKRMDYYYYHGFGKNSVKELMNKRIIFKPLRDFVTYCKTGKTLYGRERKFSQKGMRFLHATNITEIGINYEKDAKFIDPSSKMYFSNALARVGDIVFIRVGVGCAGRVAIVDVKEEEGVATDYIHILRVKDINPYFLVVYLKTKFGRDSVNLLKHGVGTVSINITDLLSLPIPVIPKRIQLEIRKKYKDILTECRKNTEGIRIKKSMAFLIYYLEEKIMNLKGGINK